MIYRIRKFRETGTIMVVGCGGTGGFVAEGLCRLLIGTHYRITLVDHDRVEEHNLGRQNFFRQDLGKFKAEVLARRLAANYGRTIDYLTSPIEQLRKYDRGHLTIGCVDNPGAREILQYTGQHSMMGPVDSYCFFDGWYIDAGNGEHSGQVLIGNALLRELKQAFFPGDEKGCCEKLPLPQIQQPALLAPETKPVRPRDCAQRVAADEQSPVSNQAMAALVLQFVHLLMKGELTWMGVYIDLETMTTSPVPIDPETVSRMTGIGLRSLVYHPRLYKERVQIRV